MRKKSASVILELEEDISYNKRLFTLREKVGISA